MNLIDRILDSTPEWVIMLVFFVVLAGGGSLVVWALHLNPLYFLLGFVAASLVGAASR